MRALKGDIVKALIWTTKRPTRQGWYWFQVTEDSPNNMARDFEAIVQVGGDEDSNTLGVRIGQINFAVRDMGGRFAGPIPPPSDD